LKKRTKKLLPVQVLGAACVPGLGEGAGIKVFWFFFTKKNILSFLGGQGAYFLLDGTGGDVSADCVCRPGKEPGKL
jgi:hypothetical protein